MRSSCLSSFELEKVEAAGHVRDMEQTLEEVRNLSAGVRSFFGRRHTTCAAMWGVVKNVTTGLTSNAVPAAMREVDELGDNGRPGLTPTQG